MNYVYVIGNKDHLVVPYEHCHVGVTKEIPRRWKEHTQAKSKVGSAIRANNWNFDDNFKIIFSGLFENCYGLELSLCDQPYMGLNCAVGGRGGAVIPWTQERRQHMSTLMKQRKMTWGHKVSETKQRLGTARGTSNPNAKQWEITSPDGNIYKIAGNLEGFCNDNQLCLAVLRSNLGELIGPPSSKYRNISEDLTRRRLNTIGWCLSKE